MLLNILLKCYVLSCTFFCYPTFKRATSYGQYGSNYEKLDKIKNGSKGIKEATVNKSILEIGFLVIRAMEPEHFSTSLFSVVHH